MPRPDAKAMEESLPGWTLAEGEPTSAFVADAADHVVSSDFQAPDIDAVMRNLPVKPPLASDANVSVEQAQGDTYLVRVTRTGPNDRLVGTKTAIVSRITGRPVGVQG